MGDPRVWFALLDRENTAVRRKASDKLAHVSGAAVDFDPDAPPAVRDEQYERLRERLGDILAPPRFREDAGAQ